MTAHTEVPAIVLPPGFVAEAEAEEISGRTIKTLQRLKRQRRIALEVKYVEMVGRKPMPTYKVSDLEKLHKANESKALAIAKHNEEQGALVAAGGNGFGALAQKLAMLSSVYGAPAKPRPLTLEEAYQYLGKKFPRRELVKRRRALAVKVGRSWLYKSGALDALWEA